jgi:hypothetical protein
MNIAVNVMSLKMETRKEDGQMAGMTSFEVPQAKKLSPAVVITRLSLSITL